MNESVDIVFSNCFRNALCTFDVDILECEVPARVNDILRAGGFSSYLVG